jgi:hypothetical protein
VARAVVGARKNEQPPLLARKIPSVLRAGSIEAGLISVQVGANQRLDPGEALVRDVEDAKREADMAMALRPDDSMILYNIACVFCGMNNAADALKAIKKAWESGYRDATWTRQDPDLALLHGDPEFDRLYPPPTP